MENVLCPLHLHCKLQAFPIYRNNNNNKWVGEGGSKRAGVWGVNSAGTEKSLRGQGGQRERERERERVQHLLFAKPCLLFYVHFTRFSLHPAAPPLLLFSLFSLSSSCCSCGCFIIYVSLCRAWLARTFVNSKRPVSISWQASLYTVCLEYPYLPYLPFPSTIPYDDIGLATWLCGFFMF